MASPPRTAPGRRVNSPPPPLPLWPPATTITMATTPTAPPMIHQLSLSSDPAALVVWHLASFCWYLANSALESGIRAETTLGAADRARRAGRHGGKDLGGGGLGGLGAQAEDEKMRRRPRWACGVISSGFGSFAAILSPAAAAGGRLMVTVLLLRSEFGAPGLRPSPGAAVRPGESGKSKRCRRSIFDPRICLPPMPAADPKEDVILFDPYPRRIDRIFSDQAKRRWKSSGG